MTPQSWAKRSFLQKVQKFKGKYIIGYFNYKAHSDATLKLVRFSATFIYELFLFQSQTKSLPLI